MKTIEEMSNWNYAEAWEFFTTNALNTYIPETALYIQSSKFSQTFDIRDDKNARNKILESVKDKRSLILFDGGSLNGKSTFARRLAKHIDCEIVDIDMICEDWIEEQLQKLQNSIERQIFMSRLDKMTDMLILKTLEETIRKKSSKSVILVGCYMELPYRAVISKTLGRYFEQMVSIYCCSKTFMEVEMLMKKRDQEYGAISNIKNVIYKEYEHSKRLLEEDGLPLGIGMDVSFIADIHVSDMFV